MTPLQREADRMHEQVVRMLDKVRVKFERPQPLTQPPECDMMGVSQECDQRKDLGKPTE